MRALLYRNLEPTFVASALTDANGGVPQAESFQSLIEQIQKQPQDLTRTISWNHDPASAETFHAMPLKGRNGGLLGVLLLGRSPRELGVLKPDTLKIARVLSPR